MSLQANGVNTHADGYEVLNKRAINSIFLPISAERRWRVSHNKSTMKINSW
jgi:hypothetical protein